MIQKAIIYQYKNDLIKAKNNLDIDLSKFTNIALSNEAIDELNLENIKYIYAENFLNSNFDWKNTENSWVNIGKFSNQIDYIIGSQNSEFKLYNIQPFLNNFLLNRHIFLNNYSLINILLNISNTNISQIYYFHNTKNIIDPFHEIASQINVIKNKQLFISIKNDHIIRNNIFRFRKYNNVSYYNIIKKRFLFILKSFHLYKNFIKNLYLNFFHSMLSIKKKNILILYSSNLFINKFIKFLLIKKKNVKIIYWNDIFIKKTNIKINKNSIINEIKQNRQKLNAIIYRDINIFDIIFPYIIHIINNDLEVIYENVVNFNRINKKYKFDLVMTQFELPIYESIFDQCDSLKINKLIFLHGGTTGYMRGSPPKLEYVRNKDNYNYLVCYTQQIANFQNNLTNELGSNSNFITLTPTFLEKGRFINKKINANKKIKVCIFLQRIFGNSDHLIDDTIVYSNLIDTVNLLSKDNKINLYIKTYNQEDSRFNLFKKIKKKFWPNVFIINENINQSIKKFDLFILFYLSTPVFEIACSNIPTIIYIDKRKFYIDDKIFKIFNKRFFITNDISDYYHYLKEILEKKYLSNFFNNDKNDNLEFYKNYCNDDKNIDEELNMNKIYKLIKSKQDNKD